MYLTLPRTPTSLIVVVAVRFKSLFSAESDLIHIGPPESPLSIPVKYDAFHIQNQKILVFFFIFHQTNCDDS